MAAVGMGAGDGGGPRGHGDRGRKPLPKFGTFNTWLSYVHMACIHNIHCMLTIFLECISCNLIYYSGLKRKPDEEEEEEEPMKEEEEAAPSKQKTVQTIQLVRGHKHGQDYLQHHGFTNASHQLERC